jgi:signal transduction histidine kinase
LRHSLHSEKIIISIHEDIHETLITVQDFGQGISSEHLDYLGQQFYRADAKDTVAGNGLGLAIVKSIMNLHEGNIKIESQLGVGTTVRLSFPK